MDADEYRRLANDFREGEPLDLDELRALLALVEEAGNYRLASRVYAQINRLAKEAR